MGLPGGDGLVLILPRFSPRPVPSRPTHVNTEVRYGIHHPSHPPGHLRHGVLHPLARLAVGDGRAGGRRQRLRRRRGGRVRAACRRAAPQRPGRRGADPARPGRRRGAGAVRAGRRTGRGDRRALPGARAGPRPRHRAARRRRARRLRRLDAAAARPRHQAARRRAEVRHRLRRARARARGARRRRPSRPCGSCSRRSGPPRPRSTCPAARRPAPASCSATPPSPPPGSACSPRPPARGDREAQIEAAREVWRTGFIAEALVRQAAPAHPGHQRRPPHRHPHRRRPRRLVRDLRGAGDVRLERLDPVQGRPLEPGPGPPPAARAAPARAAPRTAPPTTSTCWSRAASSPWPTGRPGTATPAERAARRPAVRPGTTRPGATSSASKASHELRPGSPGGRTPRLCAHARVAAADQARASTPWGPANRPSPRARRPRCRANRRSPPTAATRGDTCHLDVVDRWGNMVSATPSGGWLQSNPVVPELGFPLGTRLQMTWLEEGLPNSLTPGRRPRTTLTPSIALRDGVPVMAFGTPGGDQQDQWQLHFFLAVALRAPVRGGLDLQGAIDAPNWHNDSFPGSFYPRGMRPGSVTVESRMRPGGRRGAAAPRPRRDRRRRLVGGPAVRGRAGPGDGRPVGGGEPARHAGVRGRPVNRRGRRPPRLGRSLFMSMPPGVHPAGGDCQWGVLSWRGDRQQRNHRRVSRTARRPTWRRRSARRPPPRSCRASASSPPTRSTRRPARTTW